jgi:hypothetical protein
MQTKRYKAFWAVAALLGTSAMGVAQAQTQDNMNGSTTNGMDMRAKNAQMLINTLSEEKTEINTLAAQQMQFKRLGGRENMRLVALWNRMIRDHKAGAPLLMQLIRKHGGDPNQARILKAPVLGTQEQMLMATHRAHEMAVNTSQIRHGQTDDWAIKNAMKKRATMARKHIRWMMPYHDHNMMSGQEVQETSK